MTAAVGLYRSTIGKKVVMAVTGTMLFCFAIVHMLGNLQVYRGREVLVAYAQFLHGMGGLLWAARGVMLLCVVLHFTAAAQLKLLSNAARPVAYVKNRPRESTISSRTMIWSGIILGLFIVYHLLHLTTGHVHGNFFSGPQYVYDNFIHGFRVPLVSGFYIIAMIALGNHMLHGVWSVFQSVGLNNPSWNRRLRNLALGVTGIVILGNISMPIAVLAGLIGKDVP